MDKLFFVLAKSWIKCYIFALEKKGVRRAEIKNRKKLYDS